MIQKCIAKWFLLSSLIPHPSSLILAATLMLAGCGPGRGDVSGIVYFKNKPLDGGTITFYDEYNGVASSAIKQDGSYAVTHVATGTAKIAVASPMAIRMTGIPVAETKQVPPKYADREKSGLTCKVVSGTQEHKVELD
jgi:hypothetical protein